MFICIIRIIFMGHLVLEDVFQYMVRILPCLCYLDRYEIAMHQSLYV